MFKPSELSPPVRDAAAGLIQKVWGWISDVGAVSPDDERGRRFGYMGPKSIIAFPPGSVFGERCNIGRGSHIVGHHSIEIGDDVTTGPYVYITDQNHVYADVDTPIADQWPEDDPVTIGRGCWLGANVIVLPGAHVGDNVAIAAGSIVRGSLPDRCVAAGAPAKVVRRYDKGEWDPPLRDMSINPPEGWSHSSSSEGDPSGSS